MAPAIIMTNMAGPSPASAKLKSRPHTSQLDFSVKKRSNNFPLPQRGQRHRRPARYGEGAFSGTCLSETFILTFCVVQPGWQMTDANRKPNANQFPRIVLNSLLPARRRVSSRPVRFAADLGIRRD